MKFIIHFFLDQIEICSAYVMTPEYDTIFAAENYIKENHLSLLTDELYTGEDFTSEDLEWFEEILERFPYEGTFKIESIVPF